MNISEFGINQALKTLGVNKNNLGSSTGSNFFASGENIQSFSPVDGELIGTVQATTKEDYEKIIKTASIAFKQWRDKTAPERGEVVRQFGNKLRDFKEPLGKLVSYEMGKVIKKD
jgi:aldehyde dehydrogenase (NAD+)